MSDFIPSWRRFKVDYGYRRRLSAGGYSREEWVEQPWPENAKVIGVHGFPGLAFYMLKEGANVELDGRGAGAYMQRRPSFTESPIAAAICYAGKAGLSAESVAEGIHRKTGLTVYASPAKVWAVTARLR